MSLQRCSDRNGPFSSVENDENAEVTPDRASHQQDRPVEVELLNQILQELKAAQQETNERAKTGPSFFRRVALIFDTVFFSLYLATVVVFLLFMYITWFAPVMQ